MGKNPYRVVVLIGGNGTNLQALIDHQSSSFPYHIVGVISHKMDAYGLERAKLAGIPTSLVAHSDFEAREDFESALINALNQYEPQLIVLAGFMRVLSANFVRHYQNKIINIHPSLLPKYKGLNTHQRVIDAKEIEHGVSVHFVTDDLDGGPIIAQVKVPVLDNDTADTLRERVHRAEHRLYPQVVDWFASGRLKYEENIVTLEGKPVGARGIVS